MFEHAAASLAAARRNREPVDGLTDLRQRPNLENAYRIQDSFAAVRGSPVVGYKVGAASRASQKLVGASEPFYGLLFAADAHASGATLRRRDFFEPGMEGEFAFRIGRDLPAADGPFTIDDIAAAIDAVMPAIEICDHRFRNWRTATLEELIADNAFHGALVLGEPTSDWRTYDYATHEIELSFDGAVVGRGAGDLVLGHPLNSVLWLADTLARRGKRLMAGDIVAAGTCTGLHPAGDTKNIRAALGRLGDVSFKLD